MRINEIDLENDVYVLSGYVHELIHAFSVVRSHLPADEALSNEEQRAIIRVENIRRIMAEWEKEE